MKSLFRIAPVVIVSSWVGWVSTGCDSSSSLETTPATDCRIQKYVAVSKSKFYQQTNQSTFEYDSRGNLLKTVLTTDKRPSSGVFGTQTGTKTDTYTYNAEGYLTSATTEELYATTTDQVIQQQITLNRRFSYTNGPLSGVTTTRIGASGITTTTTNSFEYDESGELRSKIETSSSVVHDPTKVKEMPSGSTGATRIWTYQKNQLVDYVERSGTSENRPFTITNGIITRIIGSNYEVRMEYDAQQRITKQETYVDGNLLDYFTQSWYDAKSSSVALPSFKGFPAAFSIIDNTQPTVLASHKSFYRNAVSKLIEPYEESLYAVQTNKQGFVSGATISVKHPNPAAAEQDLTISETYTYTGCQ